MCGVGLAGTWALNASSAPDPSPTRSESPECAKVIAKIDAQLEKARKEGEDEILGFGSVGSEDCSAEIEEHLNER
nr:hypothetical protein [Streptomyces coryli]